ncbi:MAG: NTP/NDP exchange transporter [Colwellia sp.]
MGGNIKTKDRGNISKVIKKLFSPNIKICPGELRNTLLLTFALFFLLVSVYLLKPVREMLILTYANSEIRSYSVAFQVLTLIFVMPVYGYLSRKYHSKHFMIYVVIFFSSNLLIFYFLGVKQNHFPIVLFVWLGVFGVIIVSQFWAFVSQVFDAEAGKRLFSLITLGASMGSWCGSALARVLLNYLDAYQLIFMSIFPLLISVLLAIRIKKVYPVSGLVNKQPTKQESGSLFSGFTLLKNNSYLMLIAVFVIILNWCSSTGQYILASLVERSYEQGMLLNTITESKAHYIGKFYSEFYFWVNFLAVFIQFFLVSRLIRWLGFNNAFIITPMLFFMGYGILLLFPAVWLFKTFKATGKGLELSLQSTLIQILYLPTTRREKYESRAIIDTVCWKAGDLLQAASVFIGLNILFILPKGFILMNLVLAVLMVVLAYIIGKKHRHEVNKYKRLR